MTSTEDTKETRTPRRLSMWKLEFSLDYDPGCMVVQAYTVADARNRLLGSWNTYDVADHSFPYSCKLEDVDKVSDIMVFTGATDASKNSWTKVKNMEEAISTAFLVKVRNTAMYFCALNG